MTLHNFLYLVLITLFPGIELRLSIPVGLWNKPFELPFVGTVNGMGLSLWEVLPLVLLTNIVLGLIVYFLLQNFLPMVCRVGCLNTIYKRIVIRTQNKAQPCVEKYGLLGIALFIAIPLPGSGSWSGALIAFLLGLGYKKFAIANTVGVLIAGTLVTVGTLAAMGLL